MICIKNTMCFGVSVFCDYFAFPMGWGGYFDVCMHASRMQPLGINENE